MEDSVLAEAAAKGDQNAFNVLIERYRNYIYTIAYKISLNEEDALDITQNVFIRLVEKIGDYQGQGPFRSWLGTISTRESITYNRRPNKREVSFSPELMTGVIQELVTEEAEPEAVIELRRGERQRELRKAIELLSPQQRAIMLLRLNEGLGPSACAERLGIPAKQVRAQYYRAIVKLRGVLEESGILEELR